jgi:hypothetical protein
MTTVELYYPETTATKQIGMIDGKIFFDLTFNNDLSGNKPISKNFAISSSANDQFTAHNLFINSAEYFPSLSDPNNPTNFATHYLVIFQKNVSKSISNCVAIPICNNYDGHWSKYAKDLKITPVRSIDKLIKNQPSVLIDLNSTMNELTGIGISYKKYNNIEINYQVNDKNTMKTTLYVIDRFIYVEPFIKPSLYKQLITNSYKNREPDSKDNYKIVSVSASCGSPNSSSSSPSPLFDIGKKPDAMANFVYINVLMTVVYLIILLVFYNYYDTIPTWGMLILCVPLLIYLFGFKTGKKKKSKKKKSKKKKEKMENIEEGFKSKKRKSKKTKPIKIKINYSEFLKYTTILLMELYKKMNNINMTFFTLFLQFGKDSWDGVLNWIKNFFKSSSWAGDALIYDILKPVFNAIASILIIISLLWGSIELFFKKIIKS